MLQTLKTQVRNLNHPLQPKQRHELHQEFQHTSIYSRSGKFKCWNFLGDTSMLQVEKKNAVMNLQQPLEQHQRH